MNMSIRENKQFSYRVVNLRNKKPTLSVNTNLIGQAKGLSYPWTNKQTDALTVPRLLIFGPNLEIATIVRESAAAVDFFFRETIGGKTSESQKLEKPAFHTPVGEYEP